MRQTSKNLGMVQIQKPSLAEEEPLLEDESERGHVESGCGAPALREVALRVSVPSFDSHLSHPLLFTADSFATVLSAER